MGSVLGAALEAAVGVEEGTSVVGLAVLGLLLGA